MVKWCVLELCNGSEAVLVRVVTMRSSNTTRQPGDAGASKNSRCFINSLCTQACTPQQTQNHPTNMVWLKQPCCVRTHTSSVCPLLCQLDR